MAVLENLWVFLSFVSFPFILVHTTYSPPIYGTIKCEKWWGNTTEKQKKKKQKKKTVKEKAFTIFNLMNKLTIFIIIGEGGPNDNIKHNIGALNKMHFC